MKPDTFYIPLNRRRLLRSLVLSAGGLWAPEIFAEALALTPRATEGPYYPDHLPLDQDNDLLQIAGQDNPALGTVASFGGRLLDADGKAVKGAVIELWQADHNGCYIHSQGCNAARSVIRSSKVTARWRRMRRASIASAASSRGFTRDGRGTGTSRW